MESRRQGEQHESRSAWKTLLSLTIEKTLDVHAAAGMTKKQEEAYSSRIRSSLIQWWGHDGCLNDLAA